MRRLVRIVLVGSAVLVAVVVAILLIFREDLTQMAVKSTLEFAEEQAVQNLPEGETIEGVREEFDVLRARLQEGGVTSDDLKPLLDEFVTAYEDQEITKEEVKRILGSLRELLKR